MKALLHAGEGVTLILLPFHIQPAEDDALVYAVETKVSSSAACAVDVVPSKVVDKLVPTSTWHTDMEVGAVHAGELGALVDAHSLCGSQFPAHESYALPDVGLLSPQ